jgi:hypothetical protein
MQTPAQRIEVAISRVIQATKSLQHRNPSSNCPINVLCFGNCFGADSKYGVTRDALPKEVEREQSGLMLGLLFLPPLWPLLLFIQDGFLRSS